MDKPSSKPITIAQQNQIVFLNQRLKAAQAELDNFVGYLREEHEAPYPEWELTNVREGFVKAERAADIEGAEELLLVEEMQKRKEPLPARDNGSDKPTR